MGAQIPSQMPDHSVRHYEGDPTDFGEPTLYLDVRGRYFRVGPKALQMMGSHTLLGEIGDPQGVFAYDGGLTPDNPHFLDSDPDAFVEALRYVKQGALTIVSGNARRELAFLNLSAPTMVLRATAWDAQRYTVANDGLSITPRFSYTKPQFFQEPGMICVCGPPLKPLVQPGAYHEWTLDGPDARCVILGLVRVSPEAPEAHRWTTYYALPDDRFCFYIADDVTRSIGFDPSKVSARTYTSTEPGDRVSAILGRDRYGALEFRITRNGRVALAVTISQPHEPDPFYHVLVGIIRTTDTFRMRNRLVTGPSP